MRIISGMRNRITLHLHNSLYPEVRQYIQTSRAIHGILCTYQFVTSTSPPLPSQATPQAFELFNFWQSNSRPPVPKSCSNVDWLDGQMPHSRAIFSGV